MYILLSFMHIYSVDACSTYYYKIISTYPQHTHTHIPHTPFWLLDPRNKKASGANRLILSLGRTWTNGFFVNIFIRFNSSFYFTENQSCFLTVTNTSHSFRQLKSFLFT